MYGFPIHFSLNKDIFLVSFPKVNFIKFSVYYSRTQFWGVPFPFFIVKKEIIVKYKNMENGVATTKWGKMHLGSDL